MACYKDKVRKCKTSLFLVVFLVERLKTYDLIEAFGNELKSLDVRKYDEVIKEGPYTRRCRRE